MTDMSVSSDPAVLDWARRHALQIANDAKMATAEMVAMAAQAGEAWRREIGSAPPPELLWTVQVECLKICAVHDDMAREQTDAIRAGLRERAQGVAQQQGDDPLSTETPEKRFVRLSAVAEANGTSYEIESAKEWGEEIKALHEQGRLRPWAELYAEAKAAIAAHALPPPKDSNP